MAIVKPTAPENREVSLSKDIKLPRERYTIRFKEVVYGPSSKGNFMFTITPEIVFPDTFIAPNGSTVNIGGKELKKMYITIKLKNLETQQWDDEATQEAINRFFDQLDKWGVDTSELRNSGVDTDNMDTKLIKGLVLDAICDGEEYAQRKDPTPEQRAKKQLGDIIKDANGREIKAYFPYVVDVLGAGDATVAANKPF